MKKLLSGRTRLSMIISGKRREKRGGKEGGSLFILEIYFFKPGLPLLSLSLS